MDYKFNQFYLNPCEIIKNTHRYELAKQQH